MFSTTKWLGMAVAFITMVCNMDIIQLASSLPSVSKTKNSYILQNCNLCGTRTARTTTFKYKMSQNDGGDKWNGPTRDLRIDRRLSQYVNRRTLSSFNTALYVASIDKEVRNKEGFDSLELTKILFHISCSSFLFCATKTDYPNSSSSSFYIRNALYSDLGQVANILIESFYNPSIVVRQYLYLSELSRLQGNFPYSAKDHSFFIACEKQHQSSSLPASSRSGKEKIIGFVDVDARPGKKESDAPRPYLSDLAVLPSFRRRGVAQRLINECEKEVKLWGNDELYLRVERKNDGALKMYSRLGYEAMDHHYFGVKDTTILLRRGFIDAHETNSTSVENCSEAFADYMI